MTPAHERNHVPEDTRIVGMTDTCIFCKILEGEIPGTFVYRDETHAALMDIRPVNPGHVLVVPTQHARYLADLAPAGAAPPGQAVPKSPNVKARCAKRYVISNPCVAPLAATHSRTRVSRSSGYFRHVYIGYRTWHCSLS